MRYALLEAGRWLAERGLLAEPEWVWYLSLTELEAALAGEAAPDLSERATARQTDRSRQQVAGPTPDVIGAPFPPALQPKLSEEARQAVRARAWGRALYNASEVREADGAESEVRGIAGSAGVHTGRARVILSESEFDRIEPGDVLVCSYSSPNWTIVFGSIGAVVADEGGLPSHAAITAREYGIHCVVATKTATRAIPDGALVIVDGSNGIVRLVGTG